MAQTLRPADVADSRSNNFRFVRHLAAATVVVAHSFGLLLTSATEAKGQAWGSR